MVITLRTMVRPWMVAFLLLLTNRRSFTTSQPIAAHAEAAFEIAGDDSHTTANNTTTGSALLDTIIKNTTDAPTTEISSVFARFKDCRINGRLISFGEPVIGVARSSCETCFCINGQVRCDKVICPPIRAQISPNCGPVYSEGHCCPTSYNCSSSTSSSNSSSSNSTSNNESHVGPTATTTIMTTTTTTSTIASTITSPSTVTTDDVVSLTSSPALPPTSSSSPSSSSPSVMSTMVETQSTQSSITEELRNTTDSIIEDPMESRHANPVGLMHDGFGGFNVTEKTNNFEMDYDEPTLPPSLPNLKIIPFVAADAVVNEPAAIYDNYQPEVERVYNASDIEKPLSPVINNFSPPIETEGGFLPKDSPNGGHYVTKKFQTTTEHAVIKPIIHLDEPVVGLPPIGSVWCLSNDKKYKHGELLTDPSACNICICFNAKIVCQENCPAVKVGCQRVNDPNNSTCCGRIICNDSENDVTTENLKLTEVTTETTTTTTTTSKIKDAVIEHIIYSAPSTTNKPIITTPSTTVKMSTSSEQTSLIPITTTLKLIPASATTTEKLIYSFTSGSINRVEITTPIPKPLEDEDYSFESMFSFLFNGDTPEQPSTPSSSKLFDDHMEVETRIEHRTDDEIDEKIHLIGAKPQTESATLSQQMFKTNSNSNVEQDTNPKDQPTIKPLSDIKQNSESKHDKIEAHDFNKTVEVKPNAGIKEHVDVKPHLEIKSHIEASPHANKQQVEVNSHYGVNENTQGTLQLNFKHQDDLKSNQDLGNKHQTEVKSHFDVKDQSEIKTQLDTKLQSKVKNYTDFNYQTQMKTHFDVNNKQVGAKPMKPYLDFKLPTEVKPHFDFKQNIDISFRPEIKQHTEVKSNIGLKPLKTKFDADFNSGPSMLKISGCNIYGRMYRVGKIIAELSNPCLECMCTEIGVHCNQLKC
ncbi:mucin-5AC isoform X3 [Sipha flava]|uniref:Mucin-5AC isoform X3 n=2 Tax=Sipha flava TaxID=143950 RepID=A0A8B8F347_9HEMI|nr:mucin-5AC isoform X3 [Sipha flava]